MRLLYIIFYLFFIIQVNGQISSDGPFYYFEDDIKNVILKNQKSKLTFDAWEGELKFPNKLKKSKATNKATFFFYNDSSLVERDFKYKFDDFWIIRETELLKYDVALNEKYKSRDSKWKAIKDSLNFKIETGIRLKDSIEYYKKTQYDSNHNIKSEHYNYNSIKLISNYEYSSPNNFLKNNFKITNSDTLLLEVEYFSEEIKKNIYPSSSIVKINRHTTLNKLNNKIEHEIKKRKYYYDYSGKIHKVSYKSNFSENFEMVVAELKIKYDEVEPKDLKKIKFIFK